jgi:Domain of unknown function (DUF4294)
MFKKTVLSVLLTLFCWISYAQNPGATSPDTVNSHGDSVRTSNDIYVARAEIINGDTVWVADLDEVYIFPEKTFENMRQQRRYNRLIMNVKKAYPWAKLAGRLMVEVRDSLLSLPTEKEQNTYLKKVEKDLLDNYTEDMKKLTVTQGKILIKLVYRETGETSYDIVEFYRGKFTAFFWQALARLFGSNLKLGYDPYGEDRLIEEIVVQIEHGQL